MRAEIFDLQRASFVDGPGIRTVVFFKGCNLRCKWCHNPESQSFKPELMYYSERCTHCGACEAVCGHKDACIGCGKCAEVCMSGARKLCGYSIDTEEIMKTLQRDKMYYQTSGGGATFSGGECLMQPEPLCELLTLCRADGINTAVDTAGNADYALIKKIAGLSDIILYDVKHMDDACHCEGTGVGNGLILSNLMALLDSCPDKVIIRVPVISGFNDSDENAAALRDFIKAHNKPRSIELLPYHRLGEAKYAALSRDYCGYAIPTAETMARLARLIGCGVIIK